MTKIIDELHLQHFYEHFVTKETAARIEQKLDRLDRTVDELREEIIKKNDRKKLIFGIIAAIVAICGALDGLIHLGKWVMTYV